MFSAVVMDLLVALGVVVLVKQTLPKPKRPEPVAVNRLEPYYRPMRN